MSDCDWADDKAHKAKFEVYTDGAPIGRTEGLIGKVCGAHLSSFAEQALHDNGLVTLRRIPVPRTSARPKPIPATSP